MFDQFQARFRPDISSRGRQRVNSFKDKNEPRLRELLLRFEGTSFNKGLYRVMNADTHGLASAFVAHAFPNFAESVTCFGCDWLGRIFALDSTRKEDGAPAILMFEPGTGLVLEIPGNLLTFHESILVEDAEAALAQSFHERWLATGGAIPKQNQCIGYKQPLFLSGDDEVENLEVSDLDVYWTLSAHLIEKTRGLPPGTQIGKVELDE